MEANNIQIGDYVFPKQIPFIINDYYGYMYGNTPKDKYRLGRVININENNTIKVDNFGHRWDYHPNSLIPVKVLNVLRDEGKNLGGQIKSENCKIPYFYSLNLDGILYQRGAKIGDKIYGINGNKTYEKNHNDIIELIKNSTTIIVSKN